MIKDGVKSRSLEKFFNPKTIAIIGASDTPNKVGNILMQKLEKFKGKVVPVNPKYKIVFGKKCYPRLVDYQEEIDLAIIAIPAEYVREIIEECIVKGIKNIIIISAGFSEAGNLQLEMEISYLARLNGINLLGPNCFGIVNPYADLDTTFANLSPKKGDIAFISQSGALWSSIGELNDSIGFSGFVSLGNMAGLNFNDFIEYFSMDNHTKKIILYIEKLKNGKEFIEACKRANQRGKKIIAIKAGKSLIGKEATISHTASLASDYEIYKGAFKQAGIKFIEHPTPSLDLSSLKGKGTFIITNAGGTGALISDWCDEKNVRLLSPPIDLLGTAKAEDYSKKIKEIAREKNCQGMIIILTPQKMSQPLETAQSIVDFSKTSIGRKKWIVACFSGGESVREAKKLLEENDIYCYTGEEDIKKILKE